MVLQRRCDISVQTLNEFVNVARRKLKLDWIEIATALTSIRSVCRAVHSIDIELHEDAISVSTKYGFSFFDALLIAAALKADCIVFYSEDMQHDMIVEGRMRIINPFRQIA